jgi:hypothetical protein
MAYTHTQSSANTTWNVKHSLDTLIPVVDVWISVEGTPTVLIPESIKVIDANNIQIFFTTAIAGSAYIN